jgi:Domain of unknown function (DUF4375)
MRNRICFVKRAALISTLAGCALSLAVDGTLRAAPGSDDRPAAPHHGKSPRDVLIPIPGWSPDAVANGCHARESPDATTDATTLTRVPFWGLIDHVAGRIAVRLTLEPPDRFMTRLALLDEDLRRLVLLYTLWNSMGLRDGLRSFFDDKAGWTAPMMRNALQAAGMVRELDLFSRAMAMFGEPYPADYEARKKFFGANSPSGRLTVFDRRMLGLSEEFGSRERFSGTIVTHVNGAPALWRRIELLRETLGEARHLGFLIDALPPIDFWQPYAATERKLAALAVDYRTLLVIAAFNIEFENDGVHQFFYNSEGSIAPEVHDGLIELGLDRQAAILKRGLAMFGEPYVRDTARRRENYFHNHDGWTDLDRQLSALTDEFYALDGGPGVFSVAGGVSIEGGPGIRYGMLRYARDRRLLPC